MGHSVPWAQGIGVLSLWLVVRHRRQRPGLAQGHSRLYRSGDVNEALLAGLSGIFLRPLWPRPVATASIFPALYRGYGLYAVNFSSFDFIFSHIDSIGVWNREQFMFFVSFVLVLDNLQLTLISTNLWALGEDLKLGNIDFVLLRPIHSLFIVFFRYIRAPALSSTPIALCFMIYFGLQAQLSPLSWAILPLMVALGFALMAVTEFLISTLMFWTTEGIGVNFLRMQLQRVAQYPDFIYQTIPRRLFTFVLPILTAASAPSHFLLDPGGQWRYLILLAGSILVIWFLLLKVWKKALDRYESASS